MQLVDTIGRSLELRRPGGDFPLWRYVYGGKPKPFFHPLTTPAGFCLSLLEPHDHVWHRGLWFTIKYVNGDNFWEENEPFGTQLADAPPAVSHAPNGAVAWVQTLRWERPNGRGAAIVERRNITYTSLGADAYALDWDIALDPQTDLLLDRTEFTTWGGYGGLTMRGNRNWQNTRLLFSGGATSDRPTGVPAQWADLSGVFDGGSAKAGGVALFDHRSNLRHPQPWYGATGAGHYINAAFLFHEPLRIAAGEVLRFKYRALIHDELWESDRLQSAYDAYVREAADE